MIFFSCNSWVGSEYRYILRKHRYWLVRMREPKRSAVHEIFKDEDYGGSSMALRCARRFRDKTVEALTRGEKQGIRLGYPTPSWRRGVFFTTRKRANGGKNYELVVARCYNKFLGTCTSKSFSIGRKRDEPTAYALAYAWRKSMIKSYQILAIEKGLKPI